MICGVCGSPAALAFAGQPGYQRGTAYDLYRCTGCAVTFADPLRVDPGVYEAIYAAPERVPGYARYVRYAEAVVRSRAPLRLLARAEDVYFAIAAMLAELRLPRDARVVELGSGLGYLTYALHRAGYHAEGADVSAAAVAKATARFGPLYRVAAGAGDDDARCDVVILTELIEHVEDPVALVRDAARLLRPGGAVLLTTPNRDYFPARALWHTDAPPVHLWWFGERSIGAVAQRAGLRLAFLDFAPFAAARPWEKPPAIALEVPTYGPVLDERGAPRGAVAPPERWALFPLSRSIVAPARGAIARLKHRRLLHPEPRVRRPTLAVAMFAS